jgi:hypothetical protein
VSGLAFSDRAATAVDQAWLDCRYEITQVHSRFELLAAAAGFVLALARIVLRVAVAELIEIVSSSWAIRSVAWVLLLMNIFHLSSRSAAVADGVGLWIMLANAIFLAPICGLLTGSSMGSAPVAGLTAFSVLTRNLIYQVALPLAASPHVVDGLSWRVAVVSGLMTFMSIAIADRVRTDRRRWLLTAMLVTVAFIPFAQANAVRFALWLHDVGILSGDVIYLPKFPIELLNLWFTSQWFGLTVFATTLFWLVRRRLRDR